MWKCHTACGTGGDIVYLVQKLYSIGWREAVIKLAEEEGLPYDDTPVTARTVRTVRPHTIYADTAPEPSDRYFEKCGSFVNYCYKNLWKKGGFHIWQYLVEHRSLDESTIGTWKVGFNPKKRFVAASYFGLKGKKIYLPAGVVYPTMRDGRVYWFNIRLPTEGSELAKVMGSNMTMPPKPKYIGMRGGVRLMNGLDNHAHNHKTLIIVEGEVDMITMWQYCHDIVDVVTLGSASGKLTRSDALYLLYYDNIFVILDDDKAGKVGLERCQKMIPKAKGLTVPSKMDINDFVRYGNNLKKWLEFALSSHGKI